MATQVQATSPDRSMPDDPLAGGGLRDFAARLRDGTLSAEAATRAYLDRIAARDAKIQSFKMVAAQRAIETARGIDALLRGGTDLGPLMGVPVAVKEIFAVDGLPYGAGTDLDLTDMTPPEGAFIRRLKRAGCVILGTTRTTEFAGATINVKKPMPWNPADETVKRVCGGSSHGSAAALAAGLCAFSVGSDTGGSVRLPAALCGVVGFKSTVGRWPTEGVFALSPTLDSVGVFTRSAGDAAVIFAALDDAGSAEPPRPRALRLGRPRRYVFEQLDEPVRRAVEAALDRLRAAGVEIVETDTPDIDAAMAQFGTLLFGEFVTVMSRERLSAGRNTIDPVPWARIEVAFGMEAERLAAALRAHRAATASAAAMMAGIDALVYPTTPFLPCPVAEVQTAEAALAWNLRSGRLTRPGNFFGQCGISIPVQDRGTLPVGLQLIGPPGDDARLLAIARTVEPIARPTAAH